MRRARCARWLVCSAAGAGFGVAFEDLGERHGGPHAAGGLACIHRQARRKRLTGCAPRVRFLG
jgi:hypothetical protein